MKNTYSDVMNNLNVTNDMKYRILHNIENDTRDSNNRRKILPTIVRITSLAACLVVAIFIGKAYCYSNNDPKPPIAKAPVPVESFTSLEDLSKSVGYPVATLDYTPFEVVSEDYYSFNDDLAEINYRGEENSLILRIVPGKTRINGINARYTNKKKMFIEEQKYWLKGEEDSFSVILWHFEGYTYSIQALSGFDDEQLLNIADNIHYNQQEELLAGN